MIVQSLELELRQMERSEIDSNRSRRHPQPLHSLNRSLSATTLGFRGKCLKGQEEEYSKRTQKENFDENVRQPFDSEYKQSAAHWKSIAFNSKQMEKSC